MMWVDCHTHCHQAEHYGPAFHDAWRRAGYAPWETVDPEDYRQAMAPVDRSIVFGINAQALGVEVPNDYVANFVAQNPEQYIGFMALDFNRPDTLDEMERSRHELGLRGIKLYPVMAQFNPADDRFLPFYERAEQLHLPLLWHMGASPVAQGRIKYSLPLLLDDIASTFPTLPMIIAHIAHPWQREAAVILRKNPNLYADVSALWARPSQGYQALMLLTEWNVLDKLLFGSDYPIWTPSQAIEGLRNVLSWGHTARLPEIPATFLDDLLQRDTLALLGLDSVDQGGPS